MCSLIVSAHLIVVLFKKKYLVILQTHCVILFTMLPVVVNKFVVTMLHLILSSLKRAIINK